MATAIKYTKYTTIEGDRWDSIAQKAYGNSFNVGKIIVANPKVAIVAVLTGDIDLLIPIIVNQQTLDTALLPPWKRKNNEPSAQQAKVDASAFLNLPSSPAGSHDNSFD